MQGLRPEARESLALARALEVGRREEWNKVARWAGRAFVLGTVEGPGALWPQRGGTNMIWLNFLKDLTDAAARRMGWGWRQEWLQGRNYRLERSLLMHG